VRDERLRDVGGLPAPALVEDELGYRCRGVNPVGHGLGGLVPQRGPRAGATWGGWWARPGYPSSPSRRPALANGHRFRPITARPIQARR
jgi:hypothetical protein